MTFLKVILAVWMCSILSFVFGQETALLDSKDQMMASVNYYYHVRNPLVKKDYRLNENWQHIAYNSQWFQFEYGFGKALNTDFMGGKDTVSLTETSFIAHFPIQKWMKGKRVFDIRGALIVPAVSAGIGFRNTSNNASQTVFKVNPSVSLQLPYVGVDFRLNTDYSMGNKGLFATKDFTIYPEIGIKLDGLYNLMDAERMTVASGVEYKWVETSRRRVSETSRYTFDVVTYESMPFKWQRNATIVGSFTAVGPHVAFRNFAYAGQTRMFGLGYYIRSGYFYSDVIVETGKIGFAAAAEEAQTIDNYTPGPFYKVNKERSDWSGQYKVNRYFARFGLDLFEVFAGPNAGVEIDDTKFTRWALGLGVGYAQIKGFQYDDPTSLSAADAAFNADLSLLATSRNHAKFGESGAMITFYTSLEAGALVYTIESSRYFRANLANTTNFSVAYLFPYSRYMKKHAAIKAALNQTSK